MSAASEHFSLEEVAPGAWVALAGATGACLSNAGIIDLGDRTLVFDTFITPEAGRDLRAAAEALTGRAVSTVVNSHHHGDHVQGNQAFSGADIISSARTIELISEKSPPDLDAYADELRDWILALDAELLQAERNGDEATARDVTLSRAMARAVLASLPELTITLPNIQHNGEMIIEGSERDAHVISYGGGHTDSDTFVFLPDCGVVYAGDLLWVETHPWAGDGHPDEWVNIIFRLKALRPSTVVPGHGTVTTFEYARIFARYLTFVCDIVKQAEASSTAIVKLAETQIPPQYAAWSSAEEFRMSLEALGKRVGLQPD
ncbi:MAG: MBL fold metallo-hydrolase [Acidimicrobiia bacterium]